MTFAQTSINQPRLRKAISLCSHVLCHQVYVRSDTPWHTRGCLTINVCARTGYNVVFNDGTEENPNYALLATLEQGPRGAGVMFDFLINARSDVAFPPSPPAPPPAPPRPPPVGVLTSDEAGFEFMFEPPGAPDGYWLHWTLDGSSLKMLIKMPDPNAFVAVGFSNDGLMIGAGEPTRLA